MVVCSPIPGQETRNVRFLKERDTSFFMQDAADLRPILRAIFENPGMLETKKEAIRAIAKPEAADELVKFVLSKV